MSQENRQDREGPQGWDRGWEGHEREQQRRLARLSLYEKIQWLEQAQEMVEHLRRKRDQDQSRSSGEAD